MTNKSIFWFRQDLRLSDNPALNAAARAGSILPIYIYDDQATDDWQLGDASKVWLHHSLLQLNESLDGGLCVYRGSPSEIISDLIERQIIDGVYWNRCYEPQAIIRDTAIKDNLREKSISVHSFNGSLLWEPWQVQKADGTPYKVFTPFFRKGCMNAPAPRSPLPKPKSIDFLRDDQAIEIAELGLLPTNPRWDKSMMSHWKVGEKAALKNLTTFLDEGLIGYKEGRDFPDRPNTSRLSPHLHWGEISPNTVWYAVGAAGDNIDVDHFCTELGWREFSHALLYHFPNFPTTNFQSKFDSFPWKQSKPNLEAWQKGLTGIPLVDAGMRELWNTGYMHNRIRMVVASFLVKNLQIDWREGERWFWDTLVDADLANNSASWQWVAGSGVDAAPYFRIFNPVTQAQKFDPEGKYISQYVPELAQLETKHMYAPWTTPEAALLAANVELGTTYPHPIVDLKSSRSEALAAFKALKS